MRQLTMNLLVATAALLTTQGQAQAQGNDQIGCTLSLTRLDLKDISKREEQKATLTLKPFAGDDRTQGKATRSFEGGYQIVTTVTKAPNGSVSNKGEDLYVISSRLQRKNADGKVQVLAVHTDGSDDSIMGAEAAKAGFVTFGHNLENPEIETAAVNYGKRISAYDLVKKGLVPDGIVDSARISCLKRSK